jgi:Skp family chaperone for outer membrane proteins
VTKKIKTIILLILIGMPITIWGQLKVGYVSSDRIRTEYEEFKESESQLQLEFQKVQFEYQEMLKELDSLRQGFETQRLMSSPEWRREKEQDIKSKETAIQNFQSKKVGPEGDLVKKQSQMEYELISKVKKAVDNVAIEKGYDFIFDGSISLLYGKPTHDLTDDVLHELRKAENSSSK